MKSTKKSLLMSTISLVLCFAMLLGTTWAWFTDEVTSGVNRIQAGNLDVEMYYKHTGTGVDWKDVETESEDEPHFFRDAAGNDILWEPGVVAYTNFKVENVGNLALKYCFKTLAKGYNTVDGTKSLRDVIKFAVVDGSQSYTTRDAAISAGTEAGFKDMESFEFVGSLQANATTHPTKEFTVIAYWQPNVLEDNDYNLKNGKKADDDTTQLYINLEINLVATQLASEADSFDNQYDITAPWTGEVAESVPTQGDNENVYLVSNGAELAKIAAMVNGGNDMNGKTVKLVKDIDLNNVDWMPIGNEKAFNGVFDGDNHTVLNLKASGNECVGLFGSLFNYGTVKNLTVKNAKVSGVNYVGVIAGAVYGNIDNCKVETATVTANAVNGKEGAKAGSIAGFLREGSSMKITRCSAKNVTINGYRDLGGIVGAIYGDNTVTENTCEGVTINQFDLTGYNDGNTDLIGAIYGRNVSETGGTLQENTSTGVTINKAPKPIVVPQGQSAQEAVTEALTNAKAGDALILPATTEQLQLAPVVKENITIIGNGDTKINAVGTGNLASIPNGVTFEGIEITFGTNNYQGFHHAGKITFKNCKINGTCQTYGDMDFENCTFTAGQGSYSVWLYGSTCNFTNCHFYGVDKNTYIYPDGSTTDTIVTFTKCDFHMSGIGNDSTKSKSCVMLNQAQSNNGGRYILTMTDCTYDGYVNTTAAENTAGNTNYQGLYGIKHVTPNPSLIGNIQVPALVTINGTVVYNHPAA